MRIAILSGSSLTALVLFATTLFGDQPDAGPHFANGVKVCEVDQTSAIVWVRLTKEPEADFSKLSVFTEGLKPKESSKLRMPIEVVPGAAGWVQVRFWLQNQERSTASTPWVSVSEERDFTHQFKLSELVAGSQYHFEVAGKRTEASEEATTIGGKFKTAPNPGERRKLRFVVSTCQAIRSIDSGRDGHRAYQQMLDIDPDFFIHTGDILYYDKPPFSRDKATARAKWNLMFSYGNNRRFHQNVSSYFMKDDHDTLKNDCWPGQNYFDLTFDQGLEIFREQVGMGDSTFRTVRWGQDVQVWMTENRDFRSPNSAPDGPEKTILGQRQKRWLMDTIKASDATFKFVVSPGPIIGPDKKGKNDNHANAGFANEGQQLRNFIASQENTYVICGDRHWQYCSKDPQTGVIEFGCGPINDEHNFGGTSGRHPKMHRYFNAKGGFLVVTVDGPLARADWFHANDKAWQPGRPAKVLYSETLPITD